MQQVPAWIQILSGLLTPTIAIAGGIIAWFQWRTNEKKRKQDLFDGRFDFYNRAVSLYEELWDDRRVGTTTSDEQDALYAEASFLFGADIVQHLRTMSRNDHFDRSWFAEPLGGTCDFIDADRGDSERDQALIRCRPRGETTGIMTLQSKGATMDVGTALVVIAVLHLLVTNQGFRSFTRCLDEIHCRDLPHHRA
jgi:hypothetical protein